jgi:5-methylcytosine-specific restriction enzyme A
MNGWKDKKGNRHAQGYGSAWDKLRLRILKRDGFLCQCEECKRHNRVRLATHVDHIIARANGGTEDESNLRAINADCHVLKTVRDCGHTPKPRIGVDGWPL